MNRSYRRHRSLRALLFAGVVHLCLAITFMFSFYTPRQNRGEDALAVELINPEAFREQRRTLKPPPPKKTPNATADRSVYRDKSTASRPHGFREFNRRNDATIGRGTPTQRNAICV